MLKQLTNSEKLKVTLLLGGMSAFCFVLSIFRFYVTDQRVFLFLNWNLFLSFIPWGAAILISLNSHRKNKFSLFLLLIVWLLFFPNSPYILTDLFHLQLRSSVPIWYDLILILSFAWTGLAFGLMSLVEIEIFLKKYLKGPAVVLIIIMMLFVGSFGVYIGRYLRWNSWDVISDPFLLLSDLSERIINPFSHPSTWGMTILLGILLNMMYWTFKFFQPPQRYTTAEQ